MVYYSCNKTLYLWNPFDKQVRFHFSGTGNKKLELQIKIRIYMQKTQIL